MDALIAIVAVLSPFAFVLALVWMVLVYRRNHSKPSAEASERLNQLGRTAEHMEQRIGALERILDAEAPGWRHRHDSH